MGLLRASADAVMVGARTVHDVSPKGLWIPEYTYPDAKHLYTEYRINVLVAVAVILNPLGRGFPRNCETFGDLVKLALARNYGKMAAKHGMSSEKEVVQSLLQLVAAETATDIEKLSPDTLFPEGLKIY